MKTQKPISVLLIALVGLLVFTKTCLPGKNNLPENNRTRLFLIGPRDVIMTCPAHAHGTPEEAMEKLKGMLKNQPADKISSIAVCRANQVATLKMFAPAVARVYLNPFVLTSDNPPEAKDLIWPGLDHPFINHMRILRSAAGKIHLVACIDLRGEPVHFRKRNACFEEIQWMIFAVIGANFQGITWRAKANPAWADRLQQLEDHLKKYSEDLGTAHPVDWIERSSQNPAAAICAKDKLFICLLRSEYLRKTKNAKEVALPLNDSVQKGTLIIRPSQGVSVLSGQTLSGRPISLVRQQETVQVEYRFSGGGDMLILPITQDTKTGTNRQTKGAEAHD